MHWRAIHNPGRLLSRLMVLKITMLLLLHLIHVHVSRHSTQMSGVLVIISSGILDKRRNKLRGGNLYNTRRLVLLLL